MGVNLPRRHALGHEHFPNHRCPALQHCMAIHGKGRDASLPMTRGAVLGDDGGDVMHIRWRLGRSPRRANSRSIDYRRAEHG